MKHLLLTLLCALALAPAARALPADTLQGQAQLVRQLSASLCERLAAENQKSELGKLPEADAQALFNQAIVGAMSDNMAAFKTLLKQVPDAKQEEQAGQIGQQAVFKLVENCPVARSFVAQLGFNASKQQANITPAERPVLTPVAQRICKRLDEENAKQPFDKRAPSARSQTMEQIMETVITANSQELTDYYGEDALSDEAQMREIGTKIGLVVVEQCPSYLILMGLDAARQEAASHPASPAARKPTPRHSASPRRSTKK